MYRQTVSVPVSYHLLTQREPPAPQAGESIDHLIAREGVFRRLDADHSSHLATARLVCPCDIRGLERLAREEGGAFREGDAGTSEEALRLPYAPTYSLWTEVVGRPPIRADRLYHYYIARNGVFVGARRQGIEMLLPISPPCTLPGLVSLSPYVTWQIPRMGKQVVESMIELARCALDGEGERVERLLYPFYAQGQWQVEVPEQVPEKGGVYPVNLSGSPHIPRIEVHSHPGAAYFSEQDDVDEQWFGIYAVLGDLDTDTPTLTARAVVDGYRWTFPATELFDLPPQVRDPSTWSSIPCTGEEIVS